MVTIMVVYEKANDGHPGEQNLNPKITGLGPTRGHRMRESPSSFETKSRRKAEP